MVPPLPPIILLLIMQFLFYHSTIPSNRFLTTLDSHNRSIVIINLSLDIKRHRQWKAHLVSSSWKGFGSHPPFLCDSP